LSASRFDRTAERYRRAAAEKDWSQLVEMCEPRRQDRALDVGAGPGMLSAAQAPLVARAVALDTSAAMLADVPAGVEPLVGDAEAMPFAEKSFDLVTIVNSLHHVRNMELTLGEMARVLAPGGRIVVQDYLADPDAAAAERWERVERLRDPGHGRLPRDGEVAQLLAGHGLAVEREQRWQSTWQLEPWLAMAEPPAEAAAEIRRLVAATEFSLTAWRARFVAA
jgi:SAM-dependent methyltransferase